MPDIKFSNQYPYTDFHELNLDWVISQVKYWSERVGKSIQTIEKTGTAGLVDTYTITYSDGSTSTFDVTNGNGIASVEKTGTSGLVDTYTITFQDGSTSTFDVTNGAAAVDPTLTLPDYAADAKATGDRANEIISKFPFTTPSQFLNSNGWDSGYYYEITGGGEFRKTPIADPSWKTQAVYNLPAGTYYYNDIFQNFTIIRDLTTGNYARCTDYGMATVTGIESSVTINHPFDVYITINTGASYAMFANVRLPAIYKYGVLDINREFAMYIRTLNDGVVNYASPNTPQYLMSVYKLDCTDKALYATNKDPNFNLFYVRFTTSDVYDTWGFFTNNAGTLTAGYKYILGIVRANNNLPYPTADNAVNINIFDLGLTSLIVSATLPDNAHFSKIQQAVNYLSDNGVIYVRNGTYNEAVDMINKNLTLIGQDRDETVVIMHTDLYGTPPLEVAKGLVENMTFVVDDTDRPADPGEDHAYAVHIDWNQSYQHNLTMRNCKFVSKNYPGVGIGTRPDSTIRFENCEFISEQYIALFYHNSANVNYQGSGQLVVLDNCKLYSPNNAKCIIVQKCYDVDNSSEIQSLNSLFIANGAIPTSWAELPHVGAGNADITVTPDSFGNNADHMNGSLI